MVLGIYAGAGDDRLSLGGPGDKVGAQEHRITRSGLARVGIAIPVTVSVDHEFRCRGGLEKKVVVEGAAKVAQDPLESGDIGLPRGVHMQAQLLDGVGDVGPTKGQYWRAPVRL
jgi:hypothetical protein